MFGAEQACFPLPRSEDAMVQQHNQRSTPVPAGPVLKPQQVHWLHAEAVGRERLRLLLEQWLQRNGWSLAVVSRLAELSLLAESKEPVPDWSAGMPLTSGSWVNHKGHAWEAVGTPLSEPAEGADGWIDQGLTSRLHASGLNLYLRKRKASLTVTFLLEMGRLNEWVAKVQAGEAAPPREPRLSELVKAATVISDQQGPYGPEELLSIAGGLLVPPPWPDQATSSGALDGSVPARQLRAAAAAAGLDIIDDWAVIADLYPCKEKNRVERLQQVLRGLAQWDAQQEDDERTACMVLLQRLKDHAEPKEVPQIAGGQALASALIPAMVREISDDAR